MNSIKATLFFLPNVLLLPKQRISANYFQFIKCYVIDFHFQNSALWLMLYDRTVVTRESATMGIILGCRWFGKKLQRGCVLVRTTNDVARLLYKRDSWMEFWWWKRKIRDTFVKAMNIELQSSCNQIHSLSVFFVVFSTCDRINVITSIPKITRNKYIDF